MQAGEKGILKFMDGHDKKFIIPVYQRPYSWKRDNCLQLMKDLKDVYKNNRETHFLVRLYMLSIMMGTMMNIPLLMDSRELQPYRCCFWLS